MELDTVGKYSYEQEQEQISRLKNLGAVNKKAGKELKHIAKKRANGKGTICKRKDGRSEGRYTASYASESGKRIIKNVLGKTQAEVKEKLASAQRECMGLDVSRTDKYTVATWLRTWYDLYAQPNVWATADRYRLMIETYTIPHIGKIRLKKLTSRDLQKLYKDLIEHGRVNQRNGRGKPDLSSSTTVRSVHLMLHSAFERAVKEQLIARNPTDDCIAPMVQKLEMKPLRPEHLKSYLDAADARGVLPMFYLELVSGLRKGEFVALL